MKLKLKSFVYCIDIGGDSTRESKFRSVLQILAIPLDMYVLLGGSSYEVFLN